MAEEDGIAEKDLKQIRPLKIGLWRRILSWTRDNHSILGAAATAGSAFIAMLAVGVAVQAFLAQREANSLIQRQLSAQTQHDADERRRYLETRRTDLAKIVFDPASQIALRSYALNELAHISSVTLADFERRSRNQDRWKSLEQEPDETKRNAELRKIVTRECNESFEMAGTVEITRHILDLRNADLKGVDLSDKHVVCADFTGADFTNANLNSANFHNVLMDKVRLKNADLDRFSSFWAFIDPADDPPIVAGIVNRLNEMYGEYVAFPCAVLDDRVQDLVHIIPLRSNSELCASRVAQPK